MLNSRRQSTPPSPHRFRAAFRHRETGQIVVCPNVHNIEELPEFKSRPHYFDGDDDCSRYDDARTESMRWWEDGFVDERNRFWTRDEVSRHLEPTTGYKHMGESYALKDAGLLNARWP